MARRPLHTGNTRAGVKSALQRRRSKSKKNSDFAEGSIVDLGLGDNIVIEKLTGNYGQNYFRYGDYTHVSDLIYKCTRMIALSYRTDSKIHGDTLYDSQAMCFAIGKTIEQFIVDKVIKYHGGDSYGRWTCRCLGREDEPEVKEGIKPTEDCPKCYSPFDKYHELFLKNDEYMISGSVDLSLMLSAALYLIEIKSIKHEYWQELDRPKPEHILQILFYWWLAKHEGRPLHKQVSILYVTKNFVYSSPYKEFVINPEEELYKIDDYLYEALELKKARYDDGELPYRTCQEPTSPMAKKCEMCTLCFSW